MKNLEFNTLDHLVNSDQLNKMAQQAQESIRKMQTPMPEPHVPKHVVLPIFQKKEQQDNGNNNSNP